MEDIQTQVVKTFAKNMEFLSTYDGNLYQKIAILQQAIETGQYRQNYALEYVDGYFDVKNLQDGSWLYGTNSNEFAQKKANDIDFEKANGSISLTYKNSFTKEMADDFDKLSAINTPASLTAPLEYAIDKLGGRKPSMRKIFKFLFLGLGLGLHVGLIDEKIGAKHYLLVEDNLELFYLSLFTCDYESLSKNAKLYFVIMENQDGFKSIYDSFFYKDWIQNDFLKFSLFDDTYALKIKQIQSFISTNPALTYPFSLLLKKSLTISRVINRGYKFLNISKIYENSPLKNKKVLFLAAGPSLNTYIDWVKENRDKFIIIAVFMISAKLEKKGIKPDAFMHIDENYKPVKTTLNKISDFNYFKDIPFLLAASVQFSLFDKITTKDNIYLMEDNTGYKCGFGNMEFYSVGEAGYNLSLILGANEIYLLGLDLALDQKTGQTHAQGHGSSNETKDLSSVDEVQEVGSLKESVLYTKANRGGKVKTTPLYEISIYMMNNISKILQSQRVYNLSDGAYFEGTLPLHVDEIKFDKAVDDCAIELKSFFDSISEGQLNENDRQNLHLRKQEVKKKAKAVRKFYQHKTKNSTELIKEFLELINLLVKTPNEDIKELRGIFTAYTLFISSFLSEYFNTKDADFSKESILRIKKILHNQLSKIFYIIGLWDFEFIDKNRFESPQTCKGLESEVFEFTMSYVNHSQLKEICFEERLRADIDGKLLEEVKLVPLKEKSGVGFLATYANLRDKEYMEYLKKILTTLKEATLVAFYFEKYQMDMAKEVFGKFGEKVEFKEINGIDDIVNGCRVFCGNMGENKYLDNSMIEQIANKTLTCASTGFENALFKNVKDHDMQYSNVYDEIFECLEDFGFKKEFENGKRRSITCLINEQICKKAGIEDIEVDSSMTLADLRRDIIIKYALLSDKYVFEFNKFLQNASIF